MNEIMAPFLTVSQPWCKHAAQQWSINPVSATPNSPLFGVWNAALIWVLDLVYKDVDEEYVFPVSSFLFEKGVS